MKSIVYCFGFGVALMIILFGLSNSDNKLIQSGASLFFFMFMAFIGSFISEMRKKKIGVKVLKYIIPLFIIAIGILVYGAYTNNIIIAGIVSLILGILSIAFILLEKKKLAN